VAAVFFGVLREISIKSVTKGKYCSFYSKVEGQKAESTSTEAGRSSMKRIKSSLDSFADPL